MGEAEDAIRRRQQLSASTAELAERATTSRAIHDRDSLVRRVEELAPRALEGLRARGYPGGQIFRAYKGSFRRKQLAGWPVGGFAFKDKEQVGPDRINSIYLLSDGTWLYDETRKPTSFAEIAAQFEGGLRTPGNLLRSELPVGSSRSSNVWRATLGLDARPVRPHGWPRRETNDSPSGLGLRPCRPAGRSKGDR